VLFFEENGRKVFYLKMFPENPTGNQEKMLLIHSSGGHHSFWILQLYDFSRENEVVAIDLPGHGASGGKAFEEISGYRKFILKAAEELIKDRFFIVGHSMGGAIALDFALHHPEKLKGMVLACTGGKLPVPPSVLNVFKTGKHFEGLIALAFGQKTAKPVLDVALKDSVATPPEVWYRDFSACNRFDLTASLPSINVPALVIAGAYDLLTPPGYSRYLSDSLPSARLEVFAEAGHMTMLEQPERFNEVVLNFIKENA